MTITLHCTHCNQSMAIAPRKPGSRVDCPSCGRSVVVPSAEAADKPLSRAPARENAPAVASSRALDSPRAGADRGGAVATALPRARTATAPTVASTAIATPGATTAAQPESENRAGRTGSALSPAADGRKPLAPANGVARARRGTGGSDPVKSVLILLIVFALAALGCAFFAGFLFASKPPRNPGNPLPSKRFRILLI